VPVDINLALRPINKGQKVVETFELDAHRAQIPPYSNHYAVVSFTPTSMQSYSVIFDVTVDGQSKANRESRNTPNFSCELYGEGHLPRVTILRPAIKNKKAQTMMIFNKLLLGRQVTQQLLLVNDGVLPAKVSLYNRSLDISTSCWFRRSISISTMSRMFTRYNRLRIILIRRILSSTI
jgi:hydrocephalus-inducing protein